MKNETKVQNPNELQEMKPQNEPIPAEHAEKEAAADATPEVQKATAILRAKLPALSAAALNFEKRTGNFFRATLTKQEDGTEKLVRGVVEDSEIPADCAAEIAAKRAAAFVQAEEKNREKIVAEIAELETRLAACKEGAEQFDADVEAAKELVMSFELPKSAGRASVSARLAEVESKAIKMQSEAERLRQMLIAAGIDPDAQ